MEVLIDRVAAILPGGGSGSVLSGSIGGLGIGEVRQIVIYTLVEEGSLRFRGPVRRSRGARIIVVHGPLISAHAPPNSIFCA